MSKQDASTFFSRIQLPKSGTRFSDKNTPKEANGECVMEDYNIWADLLDTFQTSPEWIKALWLIIPPAFVLALIWLFRRRVVRVDAADDGELLYTVYKQPNGLIHIYRIGVVDDGILESLIEHQPGVTEDPRHFG